jgi:outer membrane immunogenic protein
MKKLLLAGVTMPTLVAGSALAADRVVRPPVNRAPPPVAAPILTWSGFYIGANAGWVGSTGNTITNVGTDTGPGGLGAALAIGGIPAAIDFGYSGFIGGGQIGYNWQISPTWVVGIETDVQGTNAKSTFSSAVTPGAVAVTVPVTTNASRELDWLGTFRGRVGVMPVSPLLLYATGGLAYGKRRLGIGVVAPAGNPPANAFNEVSSTKAGWTAGGGVEWKFAPNWSVKAEYLYVDLGTNSSTIFYAYDISRPPGPFTSSITASVRDRENIVRAGINYTFGGPVYTAY